MALSKAEERRQRFLANKEKFPTLKSLYVL